MSARRASYLLLAYALLELNTSVRFHLAEWAQEASYEQSLEMLVLGYLIVLELDLYCCMAQDEGYVYAVPVYTPRVYPIPGRPIPGTRHL